MFVLEGIGMAEYIARISYGKDSLKMLISIHPPRGGWDYQ